MLCTVCCALLQVLCAAVVGVVVGTNGICVSWCSESNQFDVAVFKTEFCPCCILPFLIDTASTVTQHHIGTPTVYPTKLI